MFFEYEYAGKQNAVFNIYNPGGQISSYTLAEGRNKLLISENLSNGAYFYGVAADRIIIKSDRIIVLK